MSKQDGIWLIKGEGNALRPLNQHDIELVERIPHMEENYFSFRRIRNPAHHRKYFGMIKLGFENQEHYSDMDTFRKVMEMRAGYFTEVQTEKGNKLYLPKSIAYDSLDQSGFETLYDKVFHELSKMTGMNAEDKEVFQNELAQFA